MQAGTPLTFKEHSRHCNVIICDSYVSSWDLDHASLSVLRATLMSTLDDLGSEGEHFIVGTLANVKSPLLAEIRGLFSDVRIMTS